MKLALIATILLALPMSFLGQGRAVNKALSKSPKAYALFDEEGKPAAWSDFVKEAMMRMWCSLESTTTTPSCTGCRPSSSATCSTRRTPCAWC